MASNAASKARATELLRTAVSTPVHPEFAVEDAAAMEDARALLKKWGA